MLAEYTKLYDEVADSSLKSTTPGKAERISREQWYDKQCDIMRKRVRNAARKVCSTNFEHYYEIRKEYRKLLKCKKSRIH